MMHAFYGAIVGALAGVFASKYGAGAHAQNGLRDLSLLAIFAGASGGIVAGPLFGSGRSRTALVVVTMTMLALAFIVLFLRAGAVTFDE